MLCCMCAGMLDRLVRTGFLRSFLACLNLNASISDSISRSAHVIGFNGLWYCDKVSSLTWYLA